MAGVERDGLGFAVAVASGRWFENMRKIEGDVEMGLEGGMICCNFLS